MFVADDIVIVNTQGVRWVKKVDRTTYQGGKKIFSLEICYKGQMRDIEYPDDLKRNAMFDQLTEALMKK